jgi:hypothetical protein
MRAILASLLFLPSLVFAAPVPLFDGKTFDGWEGDTAKTWRIEDGAFVAGRPGEDVPRNEFLCTTKRFGNFELRLKVRLQGTKGFINGGVQFRSERIPNHHEVKGFQADLGSGWWGALYDESRRNKMLATPNKELIAKILKPDDWNEYVIRAEGPHIQLWLNGVKTVDYTEADTTLPDKGVIAVQIHGGSQTVVAYKDITIEEL